MPTYLGAALFETTDATALLGSITGAVSDNLPAVLILVGGVAAIQIFRSMVNKAKKGRV